jgi:hypothetical protein
MSSSDHHHSSRDRNVGAIAFISVAGALMVLNGFFQALYGIAAIANDEVLVQAPNYTYKFDITTWGWIHLVFGIVLTFAGFGVYLGATWARLFGALVAGLSAIAAFASIPYSPIWSLVVLTVDIFIIWALLAHGREMRDI